MGSRDHRGCDKTGDAVGLGNRVVVRSVCDVCCALPRALSPPAVRLDHVGIIRVAWFVYGAFCILQRALPCLVVSHRLFSHRSSPQYWQRVSDAMDAAQVGGAPALMLACIGPLRAHLSQNSPEGLGWFRVGSGMVPGSGIERARKSKPCHHRRHSRDRGRDRRRRLLRFLDQRCIRMKIPSGSLRMPY